jgi:hypothetical protein
MNLQPNLKMLHVSDIKFMLKNGHPILILAFLNSTKERHPYTYVVDKENPTHIIGRCHRSVLSQFDTIPWAKPFQLHEILPTEGRITV